MCGIVGIAGLKPKVDELLLGKMTDSLRHRGPDDRGLWHSPDRKVWLGHRRLAVIDLSPGGHQPMIADNSDEVIVYNGEIYNFVQLREQLVRSGITFRSDSDTEVLLHAYRAWGPDCVERFEGMFAFAIYDRKEHKLFLARDRAGEKPLFYWHAAGEFRFASELKALMADPAMPRILDPTALEYFLTYGYVTGEACILKGVRKLSQGQTLTYDIQTDRAVTRTWWHLPRYEPDDRIDAHALDQELQVKLAESVRRQMVADVPVGILLSGGLDSSLITALAANSSTAPIRTFNVSFAGHETLDEAPFARLVSKHFGTSHEEIVAEPLALQTMEALALQLDEPIADHATLPTLLLCEQVRKHVTVALSGDGGDELFGGYPHYQLLRRHQQARKYLPAALRSVAGRIAQRLPQGVKGRNHVIGLSGDIAGSIASINVYFDEFSRQRLLQPAVLAGTERIDPEAYRANLCAETTELVDRAMRVDFRTTLVDGYLVKVDRTSMLTSLEMRVPFLDANVIDFAFRCVPQNLKTSPTARKILLRRLAKRLLPAALDTDRKQGFTMPLDKWYRGTMGNQVKSILSSVSPDIFQQSFVDKLLVNQAKGRNNANRLFMLAIFELWRSAYNVQI